MSFAFLTISKSSGNAINFPVQRSMIHPISFPQLISSRNCHCERIEAHPFVSVAA